ncbi:MAG TPA: class I SAM-dependent methyltransferase [Ktedonobacteraceae bacterium]|nr:class I SAM-dependent methyltransferase [Ktedonobacteraceae bacterium]
MVESSHKRVSIKERAFTVGGVVGINGYRVNKQTLKQRFAEEGGYQLHETPHFLLCTRAEAPKTVIIHWLAPEKVDADIGHYFMQELKPLGIFEQGPGFGDIFAAVLFSLSPYDIQRALRLYATNTLRRYRRLVMIEDSHTLRTSPMEKFSLLYRRICDLQVGEHFLDAGCGYGFLPLIIAERFPSFMKILGIDIEANHFPVIRAIAEERQLRNVHFAQADLLASDFGSIGCFDTVVALHVLEHFTEADTYRVLANLLAVTAQRLIVAVPYEEGEPEQVYGHLQLFSQPKLKAVGEWCIQQLAGAARMQYEDCVDGLLIIERV